MLQEVKDLLFQLDAAKERAHAKDKEVEELKKEIVKLETRNT